MLGKPWSDPKQVCSLKAVRYQALLFLSVSNFLIVFSSGELGLRKSFHFSYVSYFLTWHACMLHSWNCYPARACRLLTTIALHNINSELWPWEEVPKLNLQMMC
jgi:hypothetical protein